MSAGEFVRRVYETNSGDTHPIRVQPETITPWNPNGVGPATESSSARAKGGRRLLGVNARNIRGKFQGAPPAGYKQDGVIQLPVLTQDAWEGISKGDVLAYLGGQLEVTGKTPEYIN